MSNSKDFLMLVRHDLKNYERWQRKREELYFRMLPKGITYEAAKAKNQDYRDIIGEGMAILEGFDRKLDKYKLQLLERYIEAQKLIFSLDDSRLERLLDAYYLAPHPRTWSEVSSDFDISLRQAHILHSEAISKLDNNMETSIKQNIESILASKELAIA